MISDYDLCVFCAKLYDPKATGWSELWTEDQWGLTAAKAMLQDTTVVIHRGSTTPLDWYNDTVSEFVKEDPKLGSLPLGFSRPLRGWYEAHRPSFSSGMVLLGHSLGAARAVEHAGMLVADGLVPRAVVVWGEPKAGMHQLAQVLTRTTVHSYRNLDDPVCTVPVTIGLLNWQHGHELTALNAPAAPNDSWGLLRHHHIELYEAGMAKLSPMPNA